MTPDTDDIRAIAASIPLLAGYDGPVMRLGGLTNRVYHLGDHILRIPGAGTAGYINRADEAEKILGREAFRLDYDDRKFTFRFETDGSLKAEDALLKALDLLKERFQRFQDDLGAFDGDRRIRGEFSGEGARGLEGGA